MEATALSNNRNVVYDFLYAYAYITFSLPFIFAMSGFYAWYATKFLSFHTRLRNKKLAEV